MAKEKKGAQSRARPEPEPSSRGTATEGATTGTTAGATTDSPTREQPGYQVLARRYRSRDFGEVIGQDAIAKTLQNAIRTGRAAHAYLFTGTRGVGKTSMARIFAKALNAVDSLTEKDQVAGAIMRGEDIDVVEIDAASNRGIDNARDLIAGAGLMPARGRYKIYIIDEVHMLTTPAFNALLKTMEEPPPHVKFILCTTEPQSVPATIQSRCQRFDFRSISTARIAQHLREVLAAEHFTADERVIMQVARMANGSMRDALSLVERLLAAAEPLSPQGAERSASARIEWQLLDEIFGLPDESILERAVDAIGRGDAAAALAAGAELLERGVSIERSLDLLAERFRWIMLATVCGTDTDLLEVAADTREALARLAGHFDAASLVHRIALCDAVASKARDSSTPRTLFDAALVRLCLVEQFASAVGAGQGGAATGSSAPPPQRGATHRESGAPFSKKS